MTPDLLHAYHDRLLKVRCRSHDPRGNLIGKPRPYAQETMRNYMRDAAAVMRLAADRGWCVKVDSPRLAKSRFVNRASDPHLLWKRLDATPKRAGRILRFIAATGCRPSEAINLTWEQTHPENRVCVLPDHKTADVTGEPRVIALTDEALTVLRETPRTNHPNVFLNRSRRRYIISGLRSIATKHLGVRPRPAHANPNAHLRLPNPASSPKQTQRQSQAESMMFTAVDSNPHCRRSERRASAELGYLAAGQRAPKPCRPPSAVSMQGAPPYKKTATQGRRSSQFTLSHRAWPRRNLPSTS